ncbi:MAG: gamma-glutamyltransferase [Acidimicrobiia bacterium]|nr:gamma-glutamyltransferase [Acidimicrobiia bacterium]
MGSSSPPGNHHGHQGVVAAGHKLTASAGAEILRRGGNAIDAAIAAMAMACVCEPVLASIGGGGFAMIRGADTRLSLIDFFPKTPIERRQSGTDGTQVIHADFGTAIQAFRIGPATVATPGFVAGVHAMAGRGASMPLAELFDPAITAARSGVPVSRFAHFLSTVVRPILTATEATAALFAPDGKMLAEGATMVNPGLAEAFTVLAESDPIDNPVMAAILESQRAEGNLTDDDLQGYEAVERTPLTVKVGQSLVHLNPYPAAGGILIDHSLRQIESANPNELAEAFLATARARAAATDSLGRLDPALLRSQGTSHISVIDADGNACSVTVSNGSGNGELVDGYGFMLNNILGEDDLNPAGPAVWPTGTRMSSMMCPTLIEQPDGGLIALGSGGSNRIRTAISQVVAQLCFNDADLVAAVEAPRLHVEGEHLDFEDLLDDDTTDQLRERFVDHLAWPQRDLFYGGVHSARRGADGVLQAHGDPRRDGAAVIVEG